MILIRSVIIRNVFFLRKSRFPLISNQHFVDMQRTALQSEKNCT
ncbi:hypothetical protein CHCC20333_1995 [Bacillus paralicheniformis]|nr:hypothetical protein CHCC20333_1995 [Bacillus paralicheniformis]